MFTYLLSLFLPRNYMKAVSRDNRRLQLTIFSSTYMTTKGPKAAKCSGTYLWLFNWNIWISLNIKVFITFVDNLTKYKPALWPQKTHQLSKRLMAGCVILCWCKAVNRVIFILALRSQTALEISLEQPWLVSNTTNVVVVVVLLLLNVHGQQLWSWWEGQLN